MKFPLYFDYQATTPADRTVVEAMLPFFSQVFGNPHSVGHAFGWAAEEAVQIAREQVANTINAPAPSVFFTSGATESNNLAISGVARYHQREGSSKRHMITVATEHSSVLAPCEQLRQEGFEVSVLPVQANGLLDVSLLSAALRDETLLVSVMAANNEVGVLQPLAEIGALCRERGILFHTDAAQAYGKIVLDVEAMCMDMLSLSGHKIYAPKGVGALYLRRGVGCLPLFAGGGQEKGLRPGTLPVPLIVGLGKASEYAQNSMEAEQARLLLYRQRFLEMLAPVQDRFWVNGCLQKRLAGNLNLSFPGMKEETLLASLRDLALSSGSACGSGKPAPSHVLQAIGRDIKTAKASLRFGFGRFTTEEEVLHAARCVLTMLRKQGKDMA